MNEASLAQRGAHGAFGRADQTGRAVGDDQQRAVQPALAEVGEEVRPGVVRLGRRGGQADEHRLAGGVDPPGGEHRLGSRVRVVAEVRAVQEQVVQPDLVESTRLPGLELLRDLRTEPRHRRPRHPSVRAEPLDQRRHTSRVDSPRTNPAITNASTALVRVTPVPNSCEANASVVPRSFGRCNVTGPAVVFTVTGAYPLRIPARASSLSAARAYRSRPKNTVISASQAVCSSSCAPSWATRSIAPAKSPDSANTRSISTRNRSAGDTRVDIGRGLLPSRLGGYEGTLRPLSFTPR